MNEVDRHGLPVGVAYQKIIFDEQGNPCDFIFLQTNKVFRKMVGLRDIPDGRRYSEVMRGMDRFDFFGRIQRFARVALEGEALCFHMNAPDAGGGYKVCIHVSNRDKFWISIVATIPAWRVCLAWPKAARVSDMAGQMEADDADYRVITELVPDVIWVYNYTRKSLTYISPSVKCLRGFSAQEAASLSLEETFVPESLCLFRKTIEEKRAALPERKDGSVTFSNELQQYRADGSLVWTEVSVRLRFNEARELEMIGVTRDIDNRKKAQEDVRYLSYHDQMTGLYNRHFYEMELRRMDQEKDYHFPMALIFADINGLKMTNDAFGHKAGDELLIRIAGILKDEKQPGDIIARVGGDEFVMCWPDSDETRTKERIDRLRRRLEDSNDANHTILSASFGWAVRHSKEETFACIFKKAEETMYQYKLIDGNIMRSQTINKITKTLYQILPDEERHARRVSSLCMAIGRKMGMDKSELKELKMAGLLHDVGKIAIDQHLFTKENPTEQEWDHIRLHPAKGYHILKLSQEFMGIAQFILCHHERVDGKGYPRGLKGVDIPLMSRIVSVAEAYDRMIGGYPSRRPMAEDEAVAELKKHAGTQFDSEVVQLFVTEVLPARQSEKR